MKRKIITLIMTLILLALILSALFIWFHQDSSYDYECEGYQIKVGENVYCEGSKIGFVELYIKGNSSVIGKLLHTTDDSVKNGDKDIADDKYTLSVESNDQTLVSKGYETEVKGKTQVVKIYYVNSTDEDISRGVSIKLSTLSNGKTLADIKVEPSIDEEMTVWESVDLKVSVTKAGILFDATGFYKYYKPYMQDATMQFKWDDKKIGLALDNSVEEKTVNDVDIVRYKVKWREEGMQFYAIEFKDWKNIKGIKLGESEFVKEVKKIND